MGLIKLTGLYSTHTNGQNVIEVLCMCIEKVIALIESALELYMTKSCMCTIMCVCGGGGGRSLLHLPPPPI